MQGIHFAPRRYRLPIYQLPPEGSVASSESESDGESIPLTNVSNPSDAFVPLEGGRFLDHIENFVFYAIEKCYSSNSFTRFLNCTFYGDIIELEVSGAIFENCKFIGTKARPLFVKGNNFESCKFKNCTFLNVFFEDNIIYNFAFEENSSFTNFQMQSINLDLKDPSWFCTVLENYYTQEKNIFKTIDNIPYEELKIQTMACFCRAVDALSVDALSARNKELLLANLKILKTVIKPDSCYMQNSTIKNFIYRHEIYRQSSLREAKRIKA